MKFDHRHYVPCLRWKQGEYQAVLRLPDTTKRVFMPLIEVPGIGWDFEEKKAKKTIDEHLDPFTKRVRKKWGNSPCFVDFNLIKTTERMENGLHPVCFVFDGLREMQCSAIPVTGVDRDSAYQEEIKKILNKDNSGVCLRIKIEQAARSSVQEEVDSLLTALGIQAVECDLILDLGAPTNFVPLEGFSKAIQAIVNDLPYLNKWRTFTVLGTSFPKTMSGIKKGGEVVIRHEWQLYKMLVAGFRKAGLRLPTFGDYAINHPEIPELDWRVVKPSASIRYTIDDHWYIVKGDNVRDEKYGKFKQYRKLSRIVLDSRYYCDSTFSWGDNYIQECADGTGKTGHLPMWRQVGTNHHIEKVTQDIASFYDSLNTF